MPDDASAERERLIHDLEVHQAELESQNHQLRETQEMLEQSRARYANLYDFAPVAYCTFDLNGVIREINLTGATLLGAARARLIGKPFFACAPMTDTLAFANHLNECLASRGPCTTELTLLPLNREPLVLQVVSAPYFRTDGALAGCRSALTDISVRKKAEDALRLAIRMREDFLAIVSHELRNPLSTILLGAELLLKKVALAPEGRQQGRPQLESILRSAKRMARLVADLLDLSSMEAGHLSMQRGTHDLGDIVATALAIVEPAAAQKSIRLKRRLPPEQLATDCDRERIVQVLLNLVGNAIKFTPEGGTIEVEARAVADKLLCAVRDTGIGITSEQKRHLFKPYWQAESRDHQHGAGLGLSIAKGIVEFHGGKLWIDSGPGPGSTFTFTLSPPAAGHRPLTRAGAPDAAAPRRELTPSPIPGRDRGTVLVVDDDADTRSGLSGLLVSEGYQVLTAGNGQEALACLLRMETRPVVILLDLMMPVMNGWAFLAERARDARLAGIPVILISGQADAHKTASEFGLAGYIEKPIASANLLRAMQSVSHSLGHVDVPLAS
jgi:PAS domain S-box-containing protein